MELIEWLRLNGYQLSFDSLEMITVLGHDLQIALTT